MSGADVETIRESITHDTTQSNMELSHNTKVATAIQQREQGNVLHFILLYCIVLVHLIGKAGDSYVLLCNAFAYSFVRDCDFDIS